MMRKLIYLLMVIVSVSCQENIDFDLNSDKIRVVVDGSISTDSSKHLVKLTKSTSFFETEEPELVRGASVLISDGTSSIILLEEAPGEYYTPVMRGVEGRTYTLSIDYEGENYVASDQIPRTIAMDTVLVVQEEGFDFENNKKKGFLSIYLFAQESDGLGDNYLWKYQILKPDTDAWKDATPKYRDWTWGSDEFVDGNSPDQGWQIFGGIELNEIPPGSIVRLEMNSISKEYYDFLDALGKQVFRGGLFDGPPANVPTNVSNGGLGFFKASANTFAETTRTDG